MNMLRKFILPGLLAIACTAVGQNYNAEKVPFMNVTASHGNTNIITAVANIQGIIFFM